LLLNTVLPDFQNPAELCARRADTLKRPNNWFARQKPNGGTAKSLLTELRKIKFN